MRRGLAFLLVLALLSAALGAVGEETAASLSVAGCDVSQSGRNWAEHRFFTRMAERTGVRFGPFSQYRDTAAFHTWKMGLQPDSEDLPDVLFKAVLTDEETLALYGRGVLIDLSPYITPEIMPNLSALFAEHPEWRAACTLPDGAIAALPSIDPIQANNILWINTDWLRAVGMEMPTDAETLTAVLRAFRDQDANGNRNRSDEIPLTFTGMWDLRWLLHAYGVIMNDYGLVTDASGTVSCALTSDGMREGIAWLRQLWDEGLLDANGFITADTLRRITDDKAAIPYGAVFGPTVGSLLPEGQIPKYEALILAAPDGSRVYRSLLDEVTRGTFAVTSRCADVEAALRWVDYLYSPEGCYLARAGEEGSEYTVNADGTWQWTVTFDQISERIYAASAITDDLPVPGYIPPEYQGSYRDDNIRVQVEQNLAVAAVAREACPQVFFTQEEAAELARIWASLGVTIEYRLTWFVTGDEPLNDETWAAFLAALDEGGMAEVVRIWQAAVDRWQAAMRGAEEES